MNIPSLLERVKSALLSDVQTLLLDLEPKPQSDGQLTCWCPFHGDRENARSDPGGTHRPNLSVNPNTGSWHCFKCKTGGNDLITLACKVWLDRDTPGKGKEFAEALRQLAERLGVQRGVTLAQYAAFLGVPAEELAAWGLRDCTYRGAAAVAMPHYGSDGQQITETYRVAIQAVKKETKIKAKAGTPRALYGLDRLPSDPSELVIMPEGESDCHVLWHCGLAALGVPGVANFRKAFRQSKARVMRLARLFVVSEPDAVGTMPADVAAVLSAEGWQGEVQVLAMPDGTKDPRALWDACGRDAEQFRQRITRAIEQAESVTVAAKQPEPAPTAAVKMGSWEITERPDGYFMRSLAKEDSEPFQVTNWRLERRAVWTSAVPEEPPHLDAVIHCGGETPVLWPIAHLSDTRTFRKALLEAVPNASCSARHLPDLIAVLTQIGSPCPIYQGVVGPGYAGDTYVMPSILIRSGKAVTNKGEIAIRNADPHIGGYDLEMPPDDIGARRACIETLELLLTVHAESVMLPLLAHAALAPTIDLLQGSPYVLYLTGETGAGKTTAARCVLMLFNKARPWDRKAFAMLNADGTPYSLEQIGWHLQHVIVILDDIKSATINIPGIANIAQHVYDSAGRTRLTRDLTVKTDWYIRALPIFTGEQLPEMATGSASVIRRGLVVVAPKGGLSIEAVEKLSGQGHKLRQLMAGFVAYSQISEHPLMGDTPGTTASMFARQAICAASWLYEFCVSWGMTPDRAAYLSERTDQLLRGIAAESHQESQELADHEIFLQAILAGLASERLTLGASTKPGQAGIGFLHDGKVALLPTEAANAVRSSLGNMTTNSIGRALKAARVLDIEEGERPAKVIRRGEQLVRCWVLKPEMVPPPKETLEPQKRLRDPY